MFQGDVPSNIYMYKQTFKPSAWWSIFLRTMRKELYQSLFHDGSVLETSAYKRAKALVFLIKGGSVKLLYLSLFCILPLCLLGEWVPKISSEAYTRLSL